MAVTFYGSTCWTSLLVLFQNSFFQPSSLSFIPLCISKPVHILCLEWIFSLSILLIQSLPSPLIFQPLFIQQHGECSGKREARGCAPCQGSTRCSAIFLSHKKLSLVVVLFLKYCIYFLYFKIICIKHSNNMKVYIQE